MKNKTVSIDFDGTLATLPVQKYAKKLIDLGYDVWVITARYDQLNIHRWTYDYTVSNTWLWEIIDGLGLPREKVIFTNMRPKALYLVHTNIIWHLDDDDMELYDIDETCQNTIGINVKLDNWEEECDKLLNNDIQSIG